MTRRSHELDAEAAQVPGHRAQHVRIGLAGIAAAGADLAELERPAEQPARLLVQGVGQLQRVAVATSRSSRREVARR